MKEAEPEMEHSLRVMLRWNSGSWMLSLLGQCQLVILGDLPLLIHWHKSSPFCLYGPNPHVNDLLTNSVAQIRVKIHYPLNVGFALLAMCLIH